MPKTTKETDKEIKEKLKYIGLDLENIPEELSTHEGINYRPTRMLEETYYKTYCYIDPSKIEILITPLDRLENLASKYKKASFLADYIDIGEKETKKEMGEAIEKNAVFLKLLKNLEIERLEELEEYQKQLNKKMPFEVKYKENYMWQIFYSELQDKYFMLFPSNETRTETLFYIIKKKLEAINKKKTKKAQEFIYVPICDTNYSQRYLKKSELQDLENYLWLFTGEWPIIYEVYDKEENLSIQIVGQTKIYEQIKSTYKIELENKEEASKIFKLIKALFILQSEKVHEYYFRPAIKEDGSLEFYYHSKKIAYQNLSAFIKQEIDIKKIELDKIGSELIFKLESLELLQETIQSQNEEYTAKERQIVTFLECKKSFFGRMKYFFKTKKQDKQSEKKEDKIKSLVKEKKSENTKEPEIVQPTYFEEKEQYTIEDLINLCNILEDKERQLKNKEMDLKALQNKKQNLESKIRNATLYINEIESHKKSIFDFWKYTNKDSVSLLNESETKETQENREKIKRIFNYEEDIEDIAKKIDEKQRELFSKNECDAIFAIREDLSTFNIVGKEKQLKKDEKEIEKSLEKLKDEYEQNIEEIEGKDFDIFGNSVEDKTKIKLLKNNKHRENEKDKFNLLGIRLEMTTEEYKENIGNYKTLLKELQGKMYAPCDMPIFIAQTEEWNEKQYAIGNVSAIEALNKVETKKDCIYLYRFNVKEKMPIIYYSNIMFFDNYNKTLPLGMDVSEEALLYLPYYEPKLISRKNFNINLPKNEFESEIKSIQLYEYDIERKQNDK